MIRFVVLPCRRRHQAVNYLHRGGASAETSHPRISGVTPHVRRSRSSLRSPRCRSDGGLVMMSSRRGPRWAVLVTVSLVAAYGAATPAFGSAGAQAQGWSFGAPELIGSLQSVSGSSPKDAWAVGSYWTGTATKTLIEHWDGTDWTKRASASPGG